MLLEIAVGSVEDALAAQAGRAERVELNSALALGGLTPSAGLFAEVKAAVTMPIMVMVRPRPGGFCYSAAEFRVLQRDLDLALQAGAHGIVFGVLTEHGEVDEKRCREVVRHCGQTPAVFHRAFDLTPEPFMALEQLMDLGVRRVMTSGQAKTALEGAELIAELIRRAGTRLEILPAGGINGSNVAAVASRTGCRQVHCGLRTQRVDPSMQRAGIKFGSPGMLREDVYDIVEAAAVVEMRKLLG